MNMGYAIGFNPEQIDELRMKLSADYNKLGENINNGWTDVNKTINENWIGPDAVSIEGELAKRICNIYLGTKEAVQAMIDNVKVLGETWLKFQNTNVIEGADVAAQSYEFSTITVEPYDMSYVKSQCPYQQANLPIRGLVNGHDSGNKILNSVTSYIDYTKEKIQSMFNEASSQTAFLGGGQSEKIDGYITSLAGQLANLDQFKDNLITTLSSLIKAYNEQAASIGAQAASAGNNQG